MTDDKSGNSNGASASLLSVRDLRTYFRTDAGMAKAVDGVSFEVYADEVLGIVGESGSGKSVTALSVMRLIPDPPGIIAGGEILLRNNPGSRADKAGKGGAAEDNRDLLKLSWSQLRQVRGRDIGMIFQEPMTALNPVYSVGMQVMEPLRAHDRISRREAFDRAVEILQQVGIPDAKRRMGNYPHQFSGGMLQRVMIAMAIVCHPPLLIADEPTTALDVTTQAQILELILELKQRHEAGSIVLITHDLGVVAQTCQRVVVMYGGKVQEVGTVAEIFDDPRHPYTQGLLASLPARDGKRHHRLTTIPGNVPSIRELPEGCKFCTRCPEVFDRCHEQEPPLYELGGGRTVRCHLMENENSEK